MTTAKEFAALAAKIGQTADLLNPPEGVELAQARRLAVFHLRSAAKIVREIAEHKAAREERTK